MKRVNTITSLRLGHLIDDNLEDLMDIPIHLSLSLSPSSLLESDYASRDATDGTIIDFFPSRPNDLVDPRRLSKMSLGREMIHLGLQLLSGFINPLHPF